MLKNIPLTGIYRVLPYVLILLPVTLGFFFVHLFGVNVVFADQWMAIVPLFDKLSTGTLGVSDLFAQHLEHRIFFPRVAMLLLASITKYNTVAEMYLIQASLLLTLIVLLLAFKRDLRTTSYLFVPVAFMVFSFRQWENMLWGFQMAFVFVQTFGVLALYLLHISGRGGRRVVPLLGAVGSATVASFSSLPGLLIWPAGLLQLLISPAKRKKSLIVAWSLAGIGACTLYFFDYVDPAALEDIVAPERPPILRFLLDNPLAAPQYFLTLLGGSLFWDPTLALGGGFLLAGLCVVGLGLIFRYKRLGGYSFWIGLLAFSFLIMAAVMVGRLGFGTFGALGSRYASFSLLAVVSVYLILLKLALENRSPIFTALAGVTTILMLLGIAQSYPRGVASAEEIAAQHERAASILLTYKQQPYDRLYQIYPLPKRGTEAPRVESYKEHIVDYIKEQGAPTLERLGYNVFSGE